MEYRNSLWGGGKLAIIVVQKKKTNNFQFPVYRSVYQMEKVLNPLDIQPTPIIVDYTKDFLRDLTSNYISVKNSYKNKIFTISSSKKKNSIFLLKLLKFLKIFDWVTLLYSTDLHKYYTLIKLDVK